MKIELSQSGGYAGETIKLKTISGSDISDAEKKQLESLLKESDFFNIVKSDKGKDPGADLLVYNLKITNAKNKSHTVSFEDSDKTSPLSKLVSLIKKI